MSVSEGRSWLAPSKFAVDDSGDEINEAEGSTSCGSESTLTNGNTSRSNTPTLSLNGIARPGKPRNKRKRITGAAKGKSSSCSTNSRFQFKCMAKEDHGAPIFGVQFYQKLKKGEPLIVATVGSNRVSIYECLPDGPLKLLQVYADPDTEETFYCCAWSHDDSKPLLAAAGARGIVRIFAPALASCVKHYIGHGNAINDLIFHPQDPNLLLSASKDHSLRLWNVKTDFCIAIFGGVEGHRDEVLAADIQFNGDRIVSCGMDHSLKVWKLKKPEIEKAIHKSYTYNQKSARPFPTVKENFPQFTTRDIHRNYVDCTKWFGDFILSKSCENNISCWKGGKTYQDWKDIAITTTETTMIHRLDITDCDIWFMRFSLDYRQTTLALGNQKGKTYIYDLDTDDPATIKASVLFNPKCTAAVRQTALSRNGDVLVCVCDDGTLWRWDSNVSHGDTV